MCGALLEKIRNDLMIAKNEGWFVIIFDIILYEMPPCLVSYLIHVVSQS